MTLGDTAQHPRFIQTVHRRGYRFIAPVTVVNTPPVHAPATEALRQVPPPAVPQPAAPALPPMEPSLAEEHKLVTVLCCAVTGAPALAVEHGPEAMHRLMQAVCARAHEVRQRYEGTITSVTGEGVTALFGAPVGQEDHARRAVLAALELRQAVCPQPLGDVYAVGMGVHTGPVVVGRLAHAPQQLYTAMGDTLHQASQLQRLAPPGTILLSAATQALVQEEVQVATFDAPTHSGPRGPLAIDTVQDLTQRRAGVAGLGTRHRSPFVGRDRELALLHARLAHVAQGQGQVLGIAGEPGIGKSRLLAEWRRSLAGQPVTYREGHCFPYSSTTPSLPVRALFRQGWGLTEADGVEGCTAKVQQSLENAHLLSEDNASLLLQLLDIPIDGERLARFSPQECKVRTLRWWCRCSRPLPTCRQRPSTRRWRISRRPSTSWRRTSCRSAATRSSTSSSRRRRISPCGGAPVSSSITTSLRCWNGSFPNSAPRSRNSWRSTTPRRDSRRKPSPIGSERGSAPWSAQRIRKRSVTSRTDWHCSRLWQRRPRGSSTK